MTGSPLPVRVVVLTMFDPGNAPGGLGDGELRRWVDRLPLPEALPFPFGPGQLRLDRERGVLAVLTGAGNAPAAAVVTALGLDPRFDLTRAYWLMAGIAGADPERMTLGSAAWLDWVVDGDLLLEVDRSEAPPGWSTGRLPLGKAEPFARPAGSNWTTSSYPLNRGLAAWAAGLTREVALADDAGAAALRAGFGHGAPGVITGAVLGSSNFWHGHRLLAWAREWVDYWTGGEGRLVASAMEDAGIALALRGLDRAGRADADRLLMLRTASNYVVPRPGRSAAESIGSHKAEGFAGFAVALENAYRVGRTVVDEITGDWARFAATVPGAGDGRRRG